MYWIVGGVFIAFVLLMVVIAGGKTREVSELEDWPPTKETK